MATPALALQQGQAPNTCDLCEADIKIKWQCLNCDVRMCDKCKNKIHPKLKNSNKHKVIEIKTVGSHKGELDFGNIICVHHTDQLSCMFCKSCSQLACPLCLTKVHKGHDFVVISEGYKSQIKIIKEGQGLIDNDLDKLTIVEKKIQEIRKTENKKYTEVINCVKAQNDTLKRDFDKYTAKIIKEVDYQWEAIQVAFVKQESQVIYLKQKLTDYKNKVDDILNSTDAEKVFKECHVLGKYVSTSIQPSDFSFGSIPTFVPGKMTEENVGCLHKVQPDITVDLVQKFTTDLSDVLNLSITSDDSIWISNRQVLQRVADNGNKLRVITNYNERTESTAAIQAKNLLLAGTQTLKLIDGNTGKLQLSQYKVGPLVSTAVHVTENEDVYCGARSPGFPIPDRRVLIRMNNQGAHQMIYEFDKNNKRLFTFVSSITNTNSGTIFVVDRLSDNNGRVVILGIEGDVLDIYTGHLNINSKDKLFQPAQVVTTPSENVIVSDSTTNFFHILNCVGQLIAQYRTSDIGIQWPFSLCYDKSGHLYIGFCSTTGSKDKGKLCKVKISGV